MQNFIRLVYMIRILVYVFSKHPPNTPRTCIHVRGDSGKDEGRREHTSYSDKTLFH